MSEIFKPLNIGGKTMPNRFFAQAMEGNDGENGGQPSQRTIDRYIELAKGNWGAVQAEAISVTGSSLARINGMVINRKNLDSFKKLIENFKKHNDKCPIFLQITHSGARSGSFSENLTVTPGKQKPDGAQHGEARYLGSDEIEKIKDLFVEGTLLSQEAGFDGVDFKMCHGYFGGELLRPSNTRDDKWGGSFENRTRFLREGISEVKAGLKPGDFVLGSRFSMYEGIRGGCGTATADEIIEDLSEMLDLVRTMDDLGMNFVNISAGIPAQTGAITRPTEVSKYLFLHHLRYAKTVKDLVRNEKRNIKVIGSAYSTFKEDSLNVMEDMLANDYVDACGFGRQIFADPLTPAKIQKQEKVNWCILCSGCTRLMVAQVNDGCIIYNNYYKELNKSNKGESR